MENPNNFYKIAPENYGDSSLSQGQDGTPLNGRARQAHNATSCGNVWGRVARPIKNLALARPLRRRLVGQLRRRKHCEKRPKGVSHRCRTYIRSGESGVYFRSGSHAL